MTTPQEQDRIEQNREHEREWSEYHERCKLEKEKEKREKEQERLNDLQLL